ncbi:MAG: hypothetical protein QF733_03950 [Phycisphaerales bacterium]|nr:hypothetical protein [Phycisphaerales bacterium]
MTASTPDSPSEGLTVTIDDACRDRVLEWARSYRGDVTISTSSGDEHVGYLFDQGDSFIRLDPADGGPRAQIDIANITTVHFSGRDMAAGKSFQRWIKKFIDKKLAGETASIESEVV